MCRYVPIWRQVGAHLRTYLNTGGGIGHLYVRPYGLSLDHVIQITFVDYRGQVLIANNSTNPQLFFALRGGGGGSYGIVVEWTLQLVTVPSTVSWFKIDITASSDNFMAYQNWIPNMPDQLSTTLYFGSGNVMQLLGVCMCNMSTVVNTLNSQFPAATPTSSNTFEGGWVDAALAFSDLQSTNPADLNTRQEPTYKYVIRL